MSCEISFSQSGRRRGRSETDVGGIHEIALGPGDTSVGYKDVEAPVELLDDLVSGLLDGFLVGNVDLVGLDCLF